MDKEYEATRELLGKTRVKAAPVGLGEAVMRKVRAIEEKRVEWSILWALVLRGACIGVVACLLAGELVSLSGGLREVDWWTVAEGLVALSLLVGGIKVFRILVL
jgi:hypothetical protein